MHPAPAVSQFVATVHEADVAPVQQKLYAEFDPQTHCARADEARRRRQRSCARSIASAKLKARYGAGERAN